MKVVRTWRRHGTVLPLLAVSVVVLFMFVALAIDLGMLMFARTSCQNSADAAALTGTRTLDNRPPAGVSYDDYGNQRDVAITNSISAVSNNQGANLASLTTDTTKIRVGVYDYNTVNQLFELTYPTVRPTGKSWSATEVTVDGSQPAYFSRIVGFTSLPTSAVATAVHRPRDVSVILDMSGSMKFSSTLHWPPGTGGSTGATSGLLSPDPRYPRFGHFSRFPETSTPNAFRRTTTFLSGSNELFAPSNFTIDTPAGTAMIQQYRYMPTSSGTPFQQILTVSSEGALQNAFQRWNPAESSPANVNSFVPAQYNWGGYNAFAGFASGALNGPLPAPDTFITQEDGAAKYVGDRYPRKGGTILTNTTSWDPATATGSAVTGWNLLFPNSVSTLPTAATRNITGGRPGIAATATSPTGAFTSMIEGGSTWTNYIDDAWEKNGYDLNIPASISSATNPTQANSSRPTANQWAALPVPANPTNGLFQGYSMGPAWYGKTFFIWPPDPRWGGVTAAQRPDLVNTTNPAKDTNGNWIADWRRRFFLRNDSADTGSPTTYQYFNPQGDNHTVTAGTQNINQALLRTTTGHVLRDSGTAAARNFRINYRAVLAWIKTPPHVLPPNLRSGRIKYYTSIPDDVDGADSPGTNETLLDKRFWREYIDYVLGYTANETNYDPQYGLAGVDTSNWSGAISINGTTQHSYTSGARTVTHPFPYMNLTDNPNRPRLHFWFGPITLQAFLSTRLGASGLRNWISGTMAEAQTWQLKAGIRSALDDIRANHPNDQVGMTFFAGAQFQTVRSAMGQDWDNHKNALYYPFSLLSGLKVPATANNELRPYDSGLDTSLYGDLPNGNGGTDPVSGFALAFNLMSSASSIPDIGTGTGRRGAAKLVIFETDGVPNTYRQFNFTAGGINSYYTKTNTSGSTTASDAKSRAYAVIDQIVADVSASGLSLPNAPARVFPVAFGDLFSSSSSLKPDALSFLQEVAYRGKTSDSASTALPAAQIIIGTADERREALRLAFERIMQSGVQVTLVK